MLARLIMPTEFAGLSVTEKKNVFYFQNRFFEYTYHTAEVSEEVSFDVKNCENILSK
jgi:hypothetical protein